MRVALRFDCSVYNIEKTTTISRGGVCNNNNDNSNM